VSDSLLDRVAANEVAAMKECIDAYGGLVWSLARRLLAPGADVEDAVQEVFIELWNSAGRFDASVGSEVTFVAMIARRRLIDSGRRRQRQQRLVNELQQRAEPDETAIVDESLGTSEEARLAAAAIDQLRPEQQQVLKLAIHFGLTHERIAEHTGLPLGTVKTHVRRGLMKVREKLEAAKSGKTIGATP